MHILDLQSLAPLMSLPGVATLGCAALAFSRDGKRLVSVGSPPDRKISIFEWEVRIYWGRARGDPRLLCRLALAARGCTLKLLSELNTLPRRARG